MIHANIITPEETVFEGDVESLTLPTSDGEITVLGGHIPLISVLVPGTVIARKDKEEWFFACSRGVIEVDGKEIRVLADTADRAEKLEETAVEAAKGRAEKLASERRDDAEGFAEATALMEREIARLSTIRRQKARGHRSK
ncbi:ATP synthase F1 subunit epsilon [Candidatus Peribacteria bacterium]|nr:ATP synthase F1 subunit epsilon [Candidatus Peribacteria bacterium]